MDVYSIIATVIIQIWRPSLIQFILDLSINISGTTDSTRLSYAFNSSCDITASFEHRKSLGDSDMLSLFVILL